MDLRPSYTPRDFTYPILNELHYGHIPPAVEAIVITSCQIAVDGLAILVIGAVREVPVVHEGELVSGLRMKATISIDNRVSDGAEAALLMQALAGYFEEPLRLLI